MKFDKPQFDWPGEALRKTLLMDYPGCKNIREALEKQIKRNQKDSPAGIMSPAVEMQSIIDQIALHLDGFDIDSMDREKRKELYYMPMNTIEEVRLWRDRWLEVKR